MGLFAKIMQLNEARIARRINNNKELIANPKAIKEDRAGALGYFCDKCDDPAVYVPALLARFTYSLENGILDSREKERAMEGILAAEKAAVPFVQEFLVNAPSIAWPMKILGKLLQPAEIVPVLLGCLHTDVSLDQEKVDRNYDVMCHLRDYELTSEQCDSIRSFLDDYDERVRFGAVEALLAQESFQETSHLEKFLADDSPENTRIRQAVSEAFLRKGWRISNPEFLVKKGLPPGFFINKNKELATQG